jgi:hypothetical protein
MGDIVKVDEIARAPSPAETWTQNQMRKATETYELNKIRRRDRAEEADLQARENQIEERKLDIDAQKHSLAMQKNKDSTEVLKAAKRNYDEVKAFDDMLEESGPIESQLAFKYRKTIEDWSAR